MFWIATIILSGSLHILAGNFLVVIVQKRWLIVNKYSGERQQSTSWSFLTLESVVSYVTEEGNTLFISFCSPWSDDKHFHIIWLRKAWIVHRSQNEICMLYKNYCHYCYFYSCADTAIANVTISLVNWCAAFKILNTIVSDGSTYYTFETLCSLAMGLPVNSQLILLYFLRGNSAM